MTYVVRRADGSFEFREAALTPHGPRSRTLAGFLVLTDEVAARVRERATRGTDEDALRTAAVRAGAPLAPSAADGAALELIASLAAGDRLTPGLRRALTSQLDGATDDSWRWLRATDEERGVALRDLLLLADRLPRRRDGQLSFPRIPHEPAHASARPP